MNKVIVLFSGGKDSMYASMLELEKGNEVYLVTYDNGCELAINNVNHGVDRLKKCYGEKVHFLGINTTLAFWAYMRRYYYNLKPDEIIEKFGQMTVSQFNCLSCRTAMYVVTIILCKRYNIDYVVDGARKSQLFALEQPELLESFKEFFNQYNIDISFPLKDFENDFYLENEFLHRGFIPSVLEPKCVFGVPLKQNEMDQSIIDASKNVFEKVLKLNAKHLIEKNQKIYRETHTEFI